MLREQLIVRKSMARRPYLPALMAGNHVNMHVKYDLARRGAIVHLHQNAVGRERFLCSLRDPLRGRKNAGHRIPRQRQEIRRRRFRQHKGMPVGPRHHVHDRQDMLVLVNPVAFGLARKDARKDVARIVSHKDEPAYHSAFVPIMPQRRRKNISDLWDPANHCFVCGPSNPGGLRVRFRLDGEDGEQVCRAEFIPGPTHVGYSNMLHGGILYSLLDDVMANWSFLQGLRAHTARCEVRYREAVPMSVSLRLEGRLLRRRGRMLEMEGKAFRDDNGALAAAAHARFIEVPSGPAKARR